MSGPSPVTDEQEAANAAYTWRMKVQEDFVKELGKRDTKFETIEWWFSRLKRAYEKEIELHDKL